MEKNHIKIMLWYARRSMTWAFMAYTIPKNRSQAINIKDIMLATNDVTEIKKNQKVVINVIFLFIVITEQIVVTNPYIVYTE